MIKNIAIVSLSSAIVGEAIMQFEVDIGIRRLKEYGLKVPFMRGIRMKKLCIMIMVCAILTFCGCTPAARMTPEEKSETQTEQTEETRESETAPESETTPESEAASGSETAPESEAVPESEAASESETAPERTEVSSESAETHDTAGDNGQQEDKEALERWSKEMEAVDNAISELMHSEGFDDLETGEKAEKMLALIGELAENGTEEYHYPLIKAETIYYGGGDMISFEYAGGGLGGVKLEPFDPMFN